ncbi:histidine phosphatase superfamily [Xylaria arbuscula]|nr:histidine phosphatase superfamily [Xylaria arbuscula]
MPPRIHVIRHAQALHNVNQDFSHHDPELTELGYQQCKAAAKELESLDKIELILASPLQRTIQTALALFPAYTESNKRITLLPQLQEVGNTRSDTGNSREYLENKYGAVLEYSFITPDWTEKGGESPYAPRLAEKRARTTRLLIRDIAQRYAHRDVNIVVISHGNYLRLLTQDDAFFKNVEMRTYTFDPVSSEGNLLETTCSITRRTE